MPRYFYIAQSSGGETKSGTLEAQDLHQLARILKQEGLILIEAKLEEKIKKRRFVASFSFFGVPLSEKLFFTRNLKVMISAGLSLPRALETLTDQTKNRKFKKVLFEIRQKVVQGESFSESLAYYPEIFSELFQNMIKVGEESGTLENVLDILSRQIEREHDLRSKIKGAMIYPSVIILAMIGIGILMLTNVVPKLAEAFKELEIELPLTTRMVIGLADFLTKKWYLVIISFFIFILFLWQATKTKTGKKIIDTLILKIPIISLIVRKANSAYTSRTLSSLISAGVTIVRSLEITAGTLGNVYYRSAILNVAEEVKKGEKIAQAFKPYGNIYPQTFIQMISIGEETGETSSILAKLADFYEEEVSDFTKNLTSVIEPILMLIIGAVVGFFAISMIQPMYSMLQAIK